MISKIKITTPKKDDFEEVVGLLDNITDAIKSKKGWSRYTLKSNMDNQRKIFRQILEGDGKVFIAKKGKEIVGLVNLQIVRNLRHGWKRAHLEEVVVKDGYRRQGIGTKLIKSVVGYCKEENIQMVKLLCGKQLSEAQNFYEKNGFVDTDKGYRLKIDLD